MKKKSEGWLLDLYESTYSDNNVIWVIEKTKKRKKYYHRMPIDLYIYHTTRELERVCEFLKKNGSHRLN